MKVCPTCSRPIGGKGRFCFACKLPILRTHKWHIVGCYIVHDDCANPFMRLLVRAPEAAQQELGVRDLGPEETPANAEEEAPNENHT